MRGPVATLSCYDPKPADLADRLQAAVTRTGLTAFVTEAAGTDGQVAVLEVPVGDLGLRAVDDGTGWRALSEQLGRILDEVCPALALGGFSAVLDLDEPAWHTGRLQWCSGRAETARLDVQQAAAFNALVDDRLVEVRDGAVRWAAPPGVPLGVDLLSVQPLALAAATYEAWTGEPANLDPVPAADDANTPMLWFWAPPGRRDLADQVRAALPGYTVDRDADYGYYSPVAAAAPPGRVAQADLLTDLRTAVSAVRPAWAGVLPTRAFLPPGVSPQTPEASLVDHLWLDRAWAGPTLNEVLAALPGVVTEPVDDGVLLVTGPDPRDPLNADLLWTPMVRFGRLTDVARILGARVRRDLDSPPGAV